MSGKPSGAGRRSLQRSGLRHFLYLQDKKNNNMHDMALLDYIPKEVLQREGFIHISDMDAAMRAAFGTVPEIVDRRMDVPEIARWLQVSIYRLRGYIDDNKRLGIQILDKDGKLSIRQIAQMDWRRLTEQKRTPKQYTSNFQGKKRRVKS